ncbi:phosphatidate phosphatase [Trifolium repens]|nr:phosphatidate phosphatase [Trifolium repens]
MQAVGRLGSYISQGVYTVSGPFHPFGGAVDIVVVQQQDGSFKSSPWSKNSNLGSEDGGIVGRSTSRRSRILGLMFGRRSLSGEFEDAIGNKERAEIAANLLDIKWSTNGDHAVVVENEDGSFGVVAQHEKKLNGEEVSVVQGVEESSKVNTVSCSSEQTHEVMNLSHGEVYVHHQVSHSLPSKGTETEKVTMDADVVEVFEFHSQAQQRNSSDSEASMYDVDVDIGHCSSENVGTNASSYYSQDDQGSCENNTKDRDFSSTLSTPQYSLGDCLPSETSRRPSSSSSDEENFLFSDLDENAINDRSERSLTSEYIDKEDNLSYENGTKLSRVTSCPIVIPRNKDAGGEVEQRTGSLPNASSGSNSMRTHVRYPLSQSLDSTFPGGDGLKCLKLDEYKEKQLPNEQAGAKDYQDSDEFKDTALNLPPGGTSTTGSSQGTNWRIWPFPLSRSVSRESSPPIPNDDAKNTANGNSPENKISSDVNKYDTKPPKPNRTKKKIRETTPTSEQIASLNLKEGRNVVTFTFSTAMLGNQQVDAQIYLWKWNARIVISDVDGTITKSDVLGQFMPLVGVDWSQTGVAHLFSAVKENGYQLLFLSARSISQAYITRQFLLNLKQDGKVLPEGPVVISPDGLFPSLYREVIRRVPHEFKIACLETIKALFPSDCNPFYAGFGNRDTDEISYLKVGIPLGKIFIINPKGEIVVNRSLDTKSYTSMHALVNGMFPPTSSSEQEDFNSWNFWKLPPSAIDF